jgi:MFS family permease
MFDFSVFRIRNFSGAILGSVGMNFSFWPFMIYFPVYFQSGLGYNSVTAGLSLLAYTLPTLVVPPFAERLMFRHRPGAVIPAGLFTIGLGFLAIRYGVDTPHASWLTVLPGSLLAGIGLGMTNTPVTNTTTAAVSTSRAGMASGIDMSARLITLAINIALMGFILVQGIASSLISALPGSFHPQLHGLAEAVASGSGAALQQALPELSSSQVDVLLHAALAHSFGLVLLYGGIGVWILAALSFLVFGPRKISSEENAPEVELACRELT